MRDQAFSKVLAEWAEDNSPIFVVGPERSGTSLLFQQVSDHPEFCDFSEATVETFCFANPWHLLEDSNPSNYEMRLYVGQHNWSAFKQQIQFVVQANEEADRKGLPKSYLYEPNRKEIWDSRCYSELLRTFFFFAWENLGKKRLVEKTPAHIRSLPEIFDVFPNAKVLACTREPSEIIASHRKRFKKEVALGQEAASSQLQWLNRSTDEFTHYFKEVDDLIRYHLRQGRKILIVPYTELTERASDTMQSIFEYIGVENACPGEVVRSVKDRPTQSWDPLLNRPPQSNKIDVTSYLTEQEVTKVENLKEHLLDAWY